MKKRAEFLVFAAIIIVADQVTAFTYSIEVVRRLWKEM